MLCAKLIRHPCSLNYDTSCCRHRTGLPWSSSTTTVAVAPGCRCRRCCRSIASSECFGGRGRLDTDSDQIEMSARRGRQI